MKLFIFKEYSLNYPRLIVNVKEKYRFKKMKVCGITNRSDPVNLVQMMSEENASIILEFHKRLI
jgi:hypothetical protein